MLPEELNKGLNMLNSSKKSHNLMRPNSIVIDQFVNT